MLQLILRRIIVLRRLLLLRIRRLLRWLLLWPRLQLRFILIRRAVGLRSRNRRLFVILLRRTAEFRRRGALVGWFFGLYYDPVVARP